MLFTIFMFVICLNAQPIDDDIKKIVDNLPKTGRKGLFKEDMFDGFLESFEKKGLKVENANKKINMLTLARVVVDYGLNQIVVKEVLERWSAKPSNINKDNFEWSIWRPLISDCDDITKNINNVLTKNNIEQLNTKEITSNDTKEWLDIYTGCKALKQYEESDAFKVLATSVLQNKYNLHLHL